MFLIAEKTVGDELYLDEEEWGIEFERKTNTAPLKEIKRQVDSRWSAHVTHANNRLKNWFSMKNWTWTWLSTSGHIMEAIRFLDQSFDFFKKTFALFEHQGTENLPGTVHWDTTHCSWGLPLSRTRHDFSRKVHNFPHLVRCEVLKFW